MNETSSTKEIVDLAGLARRLKLSKAWLQREAIAGRIPSILAGKRRRFCPKAVEAALAERAAVGTEPVEGGEA